MSLDKHQGEHVLLVEDDGDETAMFVKHPESCERFSKYGEPIEEAMGYRCGVDFELDNAGFDSLGPERLDLPIGQYLIESWHEVIVLPPHIGGREYDGGLVLLEGPVRLEATSTSPVPASQASSGSVGAPAPPTDPRTRNLLLLGEWERTNTMTICGPHGHVTVSDKLLAEGYDEGRAFVAALVRAAADERNKESGLGLLPSRRLDPGLREGRDSAEPPSGGLAPPSVPDGVARVNGATFREQETRHAQP